MTHDRYLHDNPVAKVHRLICLNATPWPRYCLRVPSPYTSTSRPLNASSYIPFQLLHWHRFQGSDQVLVQGPQPLEQSHDDVFMAHKYLQTCELIHNCCDFVDIVQQIIIFLHLAYRELVTNKEDVRQTFHIVNVTKGLSCLRVSFATLDVCKLVAYQIEADDGYGLLDVPLVLLQHFGICVGRWSILESVPWGGKTLLVIILFIVHCQDIIIITTSVSEGTDVN